MCLSSKYESEKNSNQSQVENLQPEVRYEEENGLSIDFSEMTKEERRQVKKLIENKEKVFVKKDQPLTKALNIEHVIDTGEDLPISSRKYRTTHKERPIIKELIQDMLKNKLIEPSKSPWSSPIVLVRKKDYSIRFCVDYRKLNAVTIKDAYA